MLKRTALYDLHLAAGAKTVGFAGWDMPVHYGSQLDEHHAVRKGAGMFDVSHMQVVDSRGAQAREFLRRLWANDVAKADADGKCLYTCMLNPRGGVIDDLITCHIQGDWYRTVVNAATADKDLTWMREMALDYKVQIEPHPELCILAVQGPEARNKAAACLPEAMREDALALKPFQGLYREGWCVSRTGYTGEDGFEVIVSEQQAPDLWQALLDLGVVPCGLGARDTLRLEAGMNLYGQDMDEDTHPLESGLGWTVAWEPQDRDFIGREALVKARNRAHPKLVGLLLEGRGVLRAHQKLRSDAGEGEVTSGGYAPTLESSIGLARVPADTEGSVEVEIRGNWLPARVVNYPFVRHGAIQIDI